MDDEKKTTPLGMNHPVHLTVYRVNFFGGWPKKKVLVIFYAKGVRFLHQLGDDLRKGL